MQFLARTIPLKRSIAKQSDRKKKRRKNRGEKEKEMKGKRRKKGKKMDRRFSPRGTIMAKDELIWLHAERAALLPHVFDVIESLVFAKAIVPPFSPPAENSGLVSYREKLIFSFAEAIPPTNPVGDREK